MAESVELFDRKRRVNYRGWVIGSIVFTALWAGFGGYHLSFYRMERE